MVRIAAQYGFADWAYIWEHENNAELRAKRYDPMILAPGDEIFVPDKRVEEFPCETNRIHRFVLKTRGCFFSVFLLDECGAPYASMRYELNIDGQTFSGKTSPDGHISHRVAPSVSAGTLTLWCSDDDPEDVTKWTVKVGGLDPVDEVTGVQSTLANLGYKPGPVDGQLNPQTVGALKDFQSHTGYDNPTGDLDDRTREELRKRQMGR